MGEAKLLILKLNMPARVTRSGLRIVCWLPSPMKRMRRVAVQTALLAQIILLVTGCSKSTDLHDIGWTQPVAISSSIAGLGGAIVPHKFQDTLIGVELLKDGSGNLYLWNRENGSWLQSHIEGNPDAGGWTYLWGAAGIDQQSQSVLLPQAYCENEQLVMKVLMGTIMANGSLRGVSEKQWTTDKKTLLGETGAEVTLTRAPARLDHPNREGAGLGACVMSGSEIYIPYTVDAFTYSETPISHQGKTHYRKAFERGPFANGVFYSSDSGKTWQLEKTGSQLGIAPAMVKTTGYVYYFAGVYPLWFSRKPANSSSWGTTQVITKTFTGVNGIFDVAGDGDTAYICWMDRRHNKVRFNLTGPPIENNDIYYSCRKDSDREWSKEVQLSKGLLYCYAPTISAEGDKVVVVWAGIKTADKQHTDMGPNDIYYVTSKDAGKTWTAPLRITDGAKDGITAGMPQVALLNGVIHLLYTQGAQRSPTELSPGLTKLGEGSWPIYYQQRLFPN